MLFLLLIIHFQSSGVESSVGETESHTKKSKNPEKSTKVQKYTDDQELELNQQQLIIKKQDQVSVSTPSELPQSPQPPANFPQGYLSGFQPQNMYPVNYPYPYTPEQLQYAYPNPYTNYPLYAPYQFGPHPSNNLAVHYPVQPGSENQLLQSNQIRNYFANITLDRLINDKDLSIWDTLDKICTAAQKDDSDIEMSKTDRTVLEEKLIDLVVKLRKTN
ncbi:unnamed protein product [[Candida] boidinii]|nr:unnamed protein product [[Candida] boidinii]